MAIRPMITQVARAGDGTALAGSDAVLRAYRRNNDGTAAAVAETLWSAPTGGSSFTSIQADADGRYTAYLAEPGRYMLQETLGGIVMPYVPFEGNPAAFEAWHFVGTAGEPAFQNSWTNSGSGYMNAAFARNSEGVVRLQGLITGGANATTAFLLPAGYRPYQEIAGAAFSTIAPLACRLDILVTGGVYLVPQGAAQVSLSGIVFRAYQ